MTRDEEHLKLLSIFYFIFGGLSALGVLFGLIYVAVGIAMATGAFEPPDQGGEAPPPWLGGMIAGIGAFVVVLSALSTWALIQAGRCLRGHRWYIFCMVVAGIICLSVPFGTALGAFTFVVLNRPEVKRLFGRPAAA